MTGVLWLGLVRREEQKGRGVRERNEISGQLTRAHRAAQPWLGRLSVASIGVMDEKNQEGAGDR